MKNYLKNELKHLPMIIIVSIIFCGINTLANNHLFNSKDVDYDNSNTHIESTNVGDAIDELFDAANNFTTYDTRLQGIETKVGTGTLNTTAQNLIGGVNEVNSKIPSVINNLTSTNTTAALSAAQGKALNDKMTYKAGDVISYSTPIPFSGFALNSVQLYIMIPTDKPISASSYDVSIPSLSIFASGGRQNVTTISVVLKQIAYNCLNIIIDTTGSFSPGTPISAYMAPTFTFT